MNNVKNKIIKYITENAGTSFVEIEKIFDENHFEYKGNGAYTSAENNNIIFWYGWNEQAFNVVSSLVNEGLIEMRTCEPVIYIVDGKSLNFPIMKSECINTHHWLPVTFNLVKEESHG
ncbi:pathogenicity island protein [Staphylococcus epidermidis]|mgnify:FL=1|nr:pathogenicity island protein [Staphylococcus epidermidis]MCG2072008.1 pathogenicity island protein [Staphylococcus epidermidis]MCG2243006.1 pathogenicity island protein [Staphylococcus epidermidis]MCG2244390.1 pathogenicity island protein [Staphylococcus epidermidis]MCG2253624.1 pathogenicity island protein [Staphylococcus epidermidis]